MDTDPGLKISLTCPHSRFIVSLVIMFSCLFSFFLSWMVRNAKIIFDVIASFDDFMLD